MILLPSLKLLLNRKELYNCLIQFLNKSVMLNLKKPKLIYDNQNNQNAVLVEACVFTGHKTDLAHRLILLTQPVKLMIVLQIK